MCLCMHVLYMIAKSFNSQPHLSLWFFSSGTLLHWSTLGFPSCVSGGIVNSWHPRVGTTGCGCSAGKSCDHWQYSSTTVTWCSAWPFLTTRTQDTLCWPRDPRTSASASGLYTMKELTPVELLSSGWIFGL